MENKHEFYITIKETLERSIIVEAEDAEAALEYAEELCNDDIVELTAEDFTGRDFQLEKKEETFSVAKSIRHYKVGEGEVDG